MEGSVVNKGVKALFPAGTVIVLEKMDDIQAPKPSTKGIVDYVDNVGTIHVKWETGSSLGLIPVVGEYHIEKENM